MYLRMIEKMGKGNSHDYNLGDDDFFTYYRSSSPDLFKEFGDNVYCLVSAGTKHPMPLRKESANYLVNNDGTTYRNLTFKDSKPVSEKVKPIAKISDEDLLDEIHALILNSDLETKYTLKWRQIEYNLRKFLKLEIPEDIIQIKK